MQRHIWKFGANLRGNMTKKDWLLVLLLVLCLVLAATAAYFCWAFLVLLDITTAVAGPFLLKIRQSI